MTSNNTHGPIRTMPLPDGGKFKRGDRVEKISGSNWRGVVVGEYATSLTPEGYAVESDTETGSVQIYPGKALRFADQAGKGGTNG